MGVINNSFSGLSTAGLSQNRRLLTLHTPLGRDRLVAERLTATGHLSNGGTQCIRHGHVTGARFDGADGGFARYALRVEPWLAFLRGRRDNLAFQDKTIFDIVDGVFGDYREQGKLTPAWRWEVKDRDVYGMRSLTVQYRETDFDFVSRAVDRGAVGAGHRRRRLSTHRRWGSATACARQGRVQSRRYRVAGATGGAGFCQKQSERTRRLRKESQRRLRKSRVIRH